MFKRRVRNKNANTISDSYTKVGKEYLSSSKKSKSKAVVVASASPTYGDSGELQLVPSPGDSLALVPVGDGVDGDNGDGGLQAQERQLKQRMEVLDDLLQAS